MHLVQPTGSWSQTKKTQTWVSEMFSITYCDFIWTPFKCNRKGLEIWLETDTKRKTCRKKRQSKYVSSSKRLLDVDARTSHFFAWLYEIAFNYLNSNCLLAWMASRSHRSDVRHGFWEAVGRDVLSGFELRVMEHWGHSSSIKLDFRNLGGHLLT